MIWQTNQIVGLLPQTLKVALKTVTGDSRVVFHLIVGCELSAINIKARPPLSPWQALHNWLLTLFVIAYLLFNSYSPS